MILQDSLSLFFYYSINSISKHAKNPTNFTIKIIEITIEYIEIITKTMRNINRIFD